MGGWMDFFGYPDSPFMVRMDWENLYKPMGFPQQRRERTWQIHRGRDTCGGCQAAVLQLGLHGRLLDRPIGSR